VETIGHRTAPAYEGVVLEFVLGLAVLLVLLGLVVWDIGESVAGVPTRYGFPASRSAS
jgi:hypothetical protein